VVKIFYANFCTAHHSSTGQPQISFTVHVTTIGRMNMQEFHVDQASIQIQTTMLMAMEITNGLSRTSSQFYQMERKISRLTFNLMVKKDCANHPAILTIIFKCCNVMKLNKVTCHLSSMFK
jgi:hypothetical protein